MASRSRSVPDNGVGHLGAVASTDAGRQVNQDVHVVEGRRQRSGRTQVAPEDVDFIGPGKIVDPGRRPDQDSDLAPAPQQRRNDVAA